MESRHGPSQALAGLGAMRADTISSVRAALSRLLRRVQDLARVPVGAESFSALRSCQEEMLVAIDRSVQQLEPEVAESADEMRSLSAASLDREVAEGLRRCLAVQEDRAKALLLELQGLATDAQVVCIDEVARDSRSECALEGTEAVFREAAVASRRQGLEELIQKERDRTHQIHGFVLRHFRDLLHRQFNQIDSDVELAKAQADRHKSELLCQLAAKYEDEESAICVALEDVHEKRRTALEEEHRARCRALEEEHQEKVMALERMREQSLAELEALDRARSREHADAHAVLAESQEPPTPQPERKSGGGNDRRSAQSLPVSRCPSPRMSPGRGGGGGGAGGKLAKASGPQRQPQPSASPPRSTRTPLREMSPRRTPSASPPRQVPRQPELKSVPFIPRMPGANASGEAPRSGKPSPNAQPRRIGTGDVVTDRRRGQWTPNKTGTRTPHSVGHRTPQSSGQSPANSPQGGSPQGGSPQGGSSPTDSPRRLRTRQEPMVLLPPQRSEPGDEIDDQDLADSGDGASVGSRARTVSPPDTSRVAENTIVFLGREGTEAALPAQPQLTQATLEKPVTHSPSADHHLQMFCGSEHTTEEPEHTAAISVHTDSVQSSSSCPGSVELPAAPLPSLSPASARLQGGLARLPAEPADALTGGWGVRPLMPLHTMRVSVAGVQAVSPDRGAALVSPASLASVRQGAAAPHPPVMVQQHLAASRPQEHMPVYTFSGRTQTAEYCGSIRGGDLDARP